MLNTVITKLILIQIFFLSSNIPGYAVINKDRVFEITIEEESKVKIVHNIRYGDEPDGIEQDSNSDRILDLYIPGGRREKLPVLVFIHGGGFAGGDKESTAKICQKIAEQGFAVVSVNYYLTLKYEKVTGVSCSAYMSEGVPSNGFHPLLQKAIVNASSDTQLALLWIKCNAERYNLDLSSVALSGGSAGSMTALYTAYVSNQEILPIKAVVNLWGGLENAEHIKKGAAPLLTYHGDLDKLIHVNFAYALHDRMAEMNNVESKLHVLIGKGHAMYNLIASDKIDEIVEFLKESLKE